MHISWARLASLCHLGFISDPLIVSKFHNETHDPKGQENKIYTIVKGRETFYRRHTVPDTSCSEVKYVLKRVSFGSKDCTKELKLECAYFLGQFFSGLKILRPECHILLLPMLRCGQSINMFSFSISCVYCIIAKHGDIPLNAHD